jgi:hypothetical protein
MINYNVNTPCSPVVILTGRRPERDSKDGSDICEGKRKQCFETLKHGMKKSLVSKRPVVDRKTEYNRLVKLEKSLDWHDRKQPGMGKLKRYQRGIR